MYGTYERPPFPIKIDKPTPGDLMRELGFADVIMGASIYGGGLLTGYYASRGWPLLS